MESRRQPLSHTARSRKRHCRAGNQTTCKTLQHGYSGSNPSIDRAGDPRTADPDSGLRAVRSASWRFAVSMFSALRKSHRTFQLNVKHGRSDVYYEICGRAIPNSWLVLAGLRACGLAALPRRRLADAMDPSWLGHGPTVLHSYGSGVVLDHRKLGSGYLAGWHSGGLAIFDSNFDFTVSREGARVAKSTIAL